MSAAVCSCLLIKATNTIGNAALKCAALPCYSFESIECLTLCCCCGHEACIAVFASGMRVYRRRVGCSHEQQPEVPSLLLVMVAAACWCFTTHRCDTGTTALVNAIRLLQV